MEIILKKVLEIRKGEQIKNYFYLNGFQRSGTTLLCHLLDKHPEIICVEEPEVSKRIVCKQFDLLKNAEYDSIKKTIDFYEIDSTEYVKLVEKYLLKAIDVDSFLCKCYELFNNKGAQVIGAKEVVELTAFKYNYFKKLMSFHKNTCVKIVSIERDIKGVVNSFIKLGFFPPGKRKITDHNLKCFAKAYIKCLNDRDKYLPQNTYKLTYENLMNMPEKELCGIYRFLNVDSTENMAHMILTTKSQGIRNDFKGITTRRSVGWQKNLNTKQIEWLDKIYAKRRNTTATLSILNRF